MGVEELTDAIRAAERYPSLAAEVEAARGLKERWRKRAEAQVCLGCARVAVGVSFVCLHAQCRGAAGCCCRGPRVMPKYVGQTVPCLPPALLQALFDAAVERLSGPAEGELLSRKPGAAPVINAGKGSGWGAALLMRVGMSCQKRRACRSERWALLHVHLSRASLISVGATTFRQRTHQVLSCLPLLLPCRRLLARAERARAAAGGGDGGGEAGQHTRGQG